MRWTALLLDALLVTLFVMGYAARYVHPRVVWWPQLAAVGLPYLSVLLLAATAAIAAGGDRRLLVLHLALVGLAAVRFAPALPSVGATGPAGGALSVMTFNVWPKHPQIENWDRASALLQSTRPHLVAFQEMPRWFSPTDFLDPHGEAPERAAAYGVARPEVHPTCPSSPALLGRVDLGEPFGAAFGEAEECTPLVGARFLWRGRPATLYSVHLRPFRSKPWKGTRLWNPRSWAASVRSLKADFLARAREAEAVAALLRRERDPFVVGGDLNSTPHEWAYGHLSRGLVDAWAVGGGWGWGATYHARVPFARIDYVLVSPEWRVLGARVEDAGLSDHRPVVAYLDLPARRSGGPSRPSP